MSDENTQTSEDNQSAAAPAEGQSFATGGTEDNSAQAQAQASEGNQTTEPTAPSKGEQVDVVTLKLSEDSILSKEDLEGIEQFAKDSGLDQANAEKLLANQERFLAEVRASEAQKKEAERDGWVEAVKRDQEIGGDKLDETISFAGKATKRFGSPELTKLLNEGIGDHPELVRTFARIGRAMSDDTLTRGKESPMTLKSFAETLYASSTGKPAQT